MNAARFDEITAKYSALRVAVVGDFCLDRYLEIDPLLAETSIETGLPVHNVVHVRSQPGAAGTILNNLAALGAAEIFPIGFCGEDGEGFELMRALASRPGVCLDHFLQTPERRTFTYCKPLIVEAGQPPRELSRLDSKNWSATPETVARRLITSIETLVDEVDAVILMDQVDIPETGVITEHVLEAIRAIAVHLPRLLMMADSRRSLRDYPRVCLKMNAAELAVLVGTSPTSSIDEIKRAVAQLAQTHERAVFVTLSERGIVAASPEGCMEHVACYPLRGEIDIVGAGDSVSANLSAALASGASLREALEMAMAAASVVIHQLGTTGTATVRQLREVVL